MTVETDGDSENRPHLSGGMVSAMSDPDGSDSPRILLRTVGLCAGRPAGGAFAEDPALIRVESPAARDGANIDPELG